MYPTKKIVVGMLFLLALAACNKGSGFGSILGSIDCDYAEDLALVGNTAVVVAKADGVKLFDVSDAAHMVAIKTIPTSDQAFNVAIKDNYAFVADYSGGVQVIDVSTPSTASIVASIETETTAIDIVVRGNTVIVAEGSGYVESFNISDLDNIQLINQYQIQNQAITSIDANDDYIFVGNSGGDLFVLSRSRQVVDDEVIIETASGEETFQEEREDWVALVNGTDESSSNDQTSHYAVTDRETSFDWPVTLTTQQSNTYYTTVQVVGPSRSLNKAVVSTKPPLIKSLSKSLSQKVDYENPGTPSGQAWGLDINISGTTLYYSDWGAGLVTLDITDPATLSELSLYNDSNACYGTAVLESATILGDSYSRVVIGANAQGGLSVLDASNPASMTLISGRNIDLNMSMGDSAHGVAIDSARGIAFVADNSQKKLMAVQITD